MHRISLEVYIVLLVEFAFGQKSGMTGVRDRGVMEEFWLYILLYSINN